MEIWKLIHIYSLEEFSLRIERLETKEWDKSSELSRRTLSPHDTEMDTDTQNIIK